MTSLQPRNPDFAAVVRDSFARQGAMAYLGVELAAVGPGLCELRLCEISYRPQLFQFFADIHEDSLGRCAAGFD